ncbi:MAG: HAMP domain-containing sensor histidine kinase [Bdellovibrionota bacterium]
MENRPDSPSEAVHERLTLHLDPSVLEELGPDFSLSSQFQILPLAEAQYALLKKGERLWVNYPDGEYCDFPFYRKNISLILNGLEKKIPPRSLAQEPFDLLVKTTQSIEKRVFSAASPGRHTKDLWDEIIRKINSLSLESHSLRDLTEKILSVPFLQSFETSLVILHLKGQTKAELLGSLWRSEKVQSFIEVKEFNAFFNSVKKSKIKSFSTDTFPKLNLPFNGSFLAKEVISRKYSLVAITSRHDFLSYGREEIELFETCIDLLQPHFERLIDQEFSDKRISELRICLKDFPLPLRIKNTVTGTAFQNDLMKTELQDQDIFFTKKVMGPFSLDLYDSDELRHYAFDLFHFQRISLLGELLNTLRHELSNPLFGLMLGSQMFRTLDVSVDNKDLMKEIEKNVSRCQVIIENFSNLYQIQNDPKPVSLKKIIDESLVLAKSEGREIRKKVSYHDETENLEISVPLIFVVQILFNLIVNSAQAMRDAEVRGGELSIRVCKEDELIAIHVQDNGPGIPEEKASQLFKPFFTTKASGTGLGLVLSRNLALKMGGNLEYMMNNESNGAHFRITLPVT